MLLQWPLHHQHTLLQQSSSQGILVASQILSRAPAGSHHCPQTRAKLRHLTQLPQHCDTDHSLVSSKVYLQAKQIHCSKQSAPTHQHCQDSYLISALAVWAFCQLHWRGPQGLLLKQCWREMEPHPWLYLHIRHGQLCQEREAEPRLVWSWHRWTWASNCSQASCAALRKDTDCTQGGDKWCPKDCWTCARTSNSPLTGNIHVMYNGMNIAFSPRATKIVSLKSATGDVIMDHGQQMERWTEHYQELHSRENTTTITAVEGTELCCLSGGIVCATLCRWAQ